MNSFLFIISVSICSDIDKRGGFHDLRLLPQLLQLRETGRVTLLGFCLSRFTDGVSCDLGDEVVD